jgi:hypothetical protein
MNIKGKQLKRVRRYRVINKVGSLRGIRGYFDMKWQKIQPQPTTINIDAWEKEFDAMALCDLFGVPYEIYQASQTGNS